MTKHYHDHEQDERDYYDRESEKHLNSCLFSMKALAIMSILFLMGMMLFSCASAQPPATRSIGTVIQVDGDRVLVTFPVVNKDFSDQAANWFYIPGHAYRQGDLYPDPDKDPSIKSPFDSPDRSGQAAQGDKGKGGPQ